MTIKISPVDILKEELNNLNSKALKVLEFNKIKEMLKEYAHTSSAKEIIEALEPYENLYDVKEHLEETKEAFQLMTKKGSPPFEGIYDVSDAVVRAGKGGTLMPGQLLKLANMLRCARRFKEYVNHKDEELSYRVIEDICVGINPLKRLEDEIFMAIVGEDEISDKASITLYNLRRSLKDKNASVKDKINALMRSNSKYLQDNLYTIRGDRYVLPVKSEHKGSVPGLVHDQSSTGATLFIEPMALVNINNEIKELMLKEKAEFERILAELSSKIYDSIISVSNNWNIVLELDFIFAKARLGSHMNGSCPGINEKGIIDIIEARHPLIDTRKVVPLNIYLGKDFTSLIITGPNTGGKTVTLKTMGLLHLMGMSGLMIPAEQNSQISFFKEVFADIGDEQSIEQSLSTFSSHMTNIVNIMNNADSNSLALFDELGAGTDPTEGAALATSILEELRARGTKVVGTTHYSELKAYALRTTGVENASVEFDVKTLSPTYRLLIGVPGKSNAFEISRKLGLSDSIIAKAKSNISTDSLQFEDLIESLQEKNILAEKAMREAQSYKDQTDRLKQKYEEKLYTLEKSKEKAVIEAQRDAKRTLKEAKEEADIILKNMRELESMGYSSDARTKLEEHRNRLKGKLEAVDKRMERPEEEGEELKKVKIGQEVFLPSLNQKVVVLTMPDNRGDVQVQAGIIKINAKFKDLRASRVTKEEKVIKKREARLNLKAVATSVDLRGMDSEEAIFTVDGYLDEAFLAGIKEVTVIHGKGTGVLRKSIGDMLKRHSNVKAYRLGEYGEGGAGVTVVLLK